MLMLPSCGCLVKNVQTVLTVCHISTDLLDKHKCFIHDLSCNYNKFVLVFSSFCVVAPVNTTIAPWEPSVLENTFIGLNCSAKGNPAVNSYQWYNERDHLIWQGESLTLYNVTRHYPAIRCAAKNSVGESKSRPMKINVECE